MSEDRKRFSKRLLVGTLAALALVIAGSAVIFFWLVFEYELPHWRELRAVRKARSESGVPVSTILQRHLGAKAKDVHWHTCSYCERSGWLRSPVLHVQIHQPESKTRFLHFAFDTSRNVLVPMTYATADALPDLYPKDQLVPIAEYNLGSESYVLPRSWSYATAGTLKPEPRRASGPVDCSR